MGAVQLPDEIVEMIGRQITEGRAASEVDFVVEAVQLYADALERHQADIAAAAEEGIADIEAGRFELIAGPDDMERLQAELAITLDRLSERPEPVPT